MNTSEYRRPKVHHLCVRNGGKLSAAICLALYGMPHSAAALDSPAEQPTESSLQEIVVTAQRREQSLESVPFSITAISGTQLSDAGVTDIASLTAQVPGLSIYDLGTRLSGAVFPYHPRPQCERKQARTRPFRTFEQAPVGTYIGNSPIRGYFQLDDVERVEVLRGPQGTLYGAGSLGGALRIIPSAPELGKLYGDMQASIGQIAHSNGTSFDID